MVAKNLQTAFSKKLREKAFPTKAAILNRPFGRKTEEEVSLLVCSCSGVVFNTVVSEAESRFDDQWESYIFLSVFFILFFPGEERATARASRKSILTGDWLGLREVVTEITGFHW